jgi:uncharacterized phage protein (TIGR02220 family)
MARPAKDTVEFFPHYTTAGKTIFTLQSMYGNDGYAVWFKILEILGSSRGHYYQYESKSNWLYLVSKTGVTSALLTEILETLADLKAIDQELYEEKTIWSENFVKGLRPVYDKRSTDMPTRPSFRRETPSADEVSGEKTPQSKVKESKVEKDILSSKKLNGVPYQEIVSFLNETASVNFKASTASTKGFIKARFNEGFTLGDFKAVITAKHNDWKNDPEMVRYIRPQTLFGTKFESYLQSSKSSGTRNSESIWEGE